MISTKSLKEFDPEIAELIKKEAARKEYSLELIPSENCVSEAVLETTGSILTDKYCEGYPGKRYYGGCEYYDIIENIAIDRAKKMFGTEEANVQPHSGANANMAAFFSLLSPGDVVMGPRLDHGGHLTHGSPVNFSGKLYKIVSYGVNPETHAYEKSEVLRLAKEHKPKLIICGATMYSLQIDWQMFREVADEVGAKLMADIAHYAGLVVGGAYKSPVPYVDIVTTTTHKTLRGPRGGLILCSSAHLPAVNKAVFPGIQGGPLMHQVAAKAVAFKEALTPEFKVYAHQIVKNAVRLASELQKRGFKLVANGTQSHLMCIDLRDHEVTGKQAESLLGKVGITVNKNTVPNDPRPPAVTSGVRLGTPSITTRGFMEEDMVEVAECIYLAIDAKDDETKLASTHKKVIELCKKHPLFPHRL